MFGLTFTNDQRGWFRTKLNDNKHKLSFPNGEISILTSTSLSYRLLLYFTPRLCSFSKQCFLVNAFANHAVSPVMDHQRISTNKLIYL